MGFRIKTSKEIIEFGVMVIPCRKNKVLYKMRGANLETLAFFRNDSCADEFDKMLDQIVNILNRE